MSDAIYDSAEIKKIGNLIRTRSKPNSGGCWIWQMSITSRGYGAMWVGGKCEQAHRLSYKAFTGNPNGYLVCHKCDVKACVNPKHLFLGDGGDNLQDSYDKGRRGKIFGDKKEKLLRLIVIDVNYGIISKQFGIVRSAITYWKNKELKNGIRT